MNSREENLLKKVDDISQRAKELIAQKAARITELENLLAQVEADGNVKRALLADIERKLGRK